MPSVEAAHLRAALSFERAAVLHDQTAEHFDGRKLPQLAGRERDRARLNRDRATVEVELARLRRDWIARSRARGAGADAFGVTWDPPAI